MMPLGAADAGMVEAQLADLRQENADLLALVDAQGRQIEALNDSMTMQEEYIETFVANYNRHTH